MRTLTYSLLVLSPPASGHSAVTALRFAEALLRRGHKLYRIFFLDDGVYQGMATGVAAQDEFDPLAAWDQLAQGQGIELILCISSALKRGLLDASEAARHDLDAVTVHPSFSIGGLGLLVDAGAHSDRLVSFGG